MEKYIQVVHSDTTITYNEGENKWTFTLRGRDRSADSLAKAKEFIDKPVPPEKAKPFEKIPAWFFPYNDTPQKVEVTGIGGTDYGRSETVWITAKGKRSKERVFQAIFPQSEKNDADVAQIILKQQEVGKLNREIGEIKRKLTPLVLPKDE